MKVVKTFNFDIAHLLDGHDGKCKNLHGHTYRLEVEVAGPVIEDGPKKGMVIDFADLKSVVDDLIIARMDHAFLYDSTNERETAIAQLLEGWNMKTYPFKHRTTAENISRHIFDLLRERLEGVNRVRLWETPSSYSECTFDDEI
ncbi:6-carboxytetrahydropterin synthase QueD [Taylorella equigenitalis]|uniref:6-carboxy-5,6,7,8-tetrahydropterin synthase n=2 Tax=Taylorella equigenitalis TaxID=29575 RepID=A0A654KHD6_TAYEM|nr:6-carboxytetrahydropterin synthase QueD [Taylorella equigenitalis]ADU91809.1 Queuosine biosynthesis QueD, PTPS-I [Taylorella equigenitalis MCE9]ASY30034.1 6-carboxytetrahydropterin synthase QueD [Taylorella equigenitalis]ASY37339.1 6-carboxytetrahydropterin synthase QueD [Taylorella equigenitalis]ASY41762.1 6-carboxytetrahydropterin synthase QueD [Taylorella equigenitalis]KGK33566.1 6-carboxy-5,6,7,8-tetrahydropterin synthase [Taylorella equigenitalis]